MKPSTISWRAAENALGLERLPAFHRAFLAGRGVAAAAMPLRRVGQRVEAELNRMVAEGRAVRDGDDWQVSGEALAGLGLSEFIGPSAQEKGPRN